MSDTAEAPLALFLADCPARTGHTAFIAHSDSRMARLARALPMLCAGRVELLMLPPWDVLPYDRTAPSAAIVGQRIATLMRLAAPANGRPRLLLTSAEAALQRVPPPGGWTEPLAIESGQPIDLDALRHRMAELGYHLGEAVSEPGEVAFRGHVIDLFPVDAACPVRLEIEDGRITTMHRFDAATQRRDGDALPGLCVVPATEFPLDPAQADEFLEGEDTPMALPSGRLVPVFDYLKDFGIVLDDAVPERWAALHDAAKDAYEASRRMHRAAADGLVLPRPDRLFLAPARAAERCAGATAPVPGAVPEPPPRRVADLLARARQATTPVVVAAPGDAARLAASLAKRGLEARAATDWADATAGGVACLPLDIDSGLRTDSLLVLQAAHLVRQGNAAHPATLLEHDGAPRVGDVVVHMDHGAARLAALKPHDGEERIALAFADNAELLVSPAELDRIWRYGTAGTLDRMGGDAWRAKRAEIEAEIAGTAAMLAERAVERGARRAPVMEPDRAAYDKLARRFPYALTADQHMAVEAVLHDLRRGHPMDRLVCGDVGFGKTEVALRATAAVALSGHQVAVVAPTTVLARQHVETFRRRFEGSGLRVEALMGAGPENKEVRAGLADGSVRIVVGTHAIGAKDMRFQQLGLVVIDEEQRFGQAQKGGLTDPAAHLLVMTATPIPRTMQSAMVGLRDVSVIATAPRHRQPTRTFVAEFDPALVREALRREHARGGQSFVVCPRISDLAPMAARLRHLAPGLHVVEAHGRMKADALEAAVVGFAQGHGDVLLATNIIEAGLDVPRANTILVMHADRFGLAQLHQVRGRVGRGTRRGSAYLVTEPGRRLTAATRARLRTLEQLGSLHAGVAIAAADMDQRGAGELFGEAQAGHVSALGTDLYHHLLVQAVQARNGTQPPPPPPELHVELAGRISDGMVPEPDLRLALYRRLARLERAAEVDEFAEEMVDRFGEADAGLEALLALARLRCAGAVRSLARIDAGPKGAGLTPHDPATLADLAEQVGGTVRDGRVLVGMASPDPAARVAGLVSLLS